MKKLEIYFSLKLKRERKKIVVSIPESQDSFIFLYFHPWGLASGLTSWAKNQPLQGRTQWRQKNGGRRKKPKMIAPNSVVL